jgi:hypothetical protein
MRIGSGFDRCLHPALHWLARITIDGTEEIEGRSIGRHGDPLGRLDLV